MKPLLTTSLITLIILLIALIIKSKIPEKPTEQEETKLTTLEPLKTREELILDEIKLYEWDTTTALAIAKAESGLDPHAINKTSGAMGLFQILPLHCYRLIDQPCDKLLELKYNVLMAYALWRENGWTPWEVYRTGAYERYL